MLQQGGQRDGSLVAVIRREEGAPGMAKDRCCSSSNDRAGSAKTVSVRALALQAAAVR